MYYLNKTSLSLQDLALSEFDPCFKCCLNVLLLVCVVDSKTLLGDNTIAVLYKGGIIIIHNSQKERLKRETETRFLSSQ